VWRETINRLAELLAYGRAVAQWRNNRGSWEIEHVQIEEPFRARQVLTTLARALARVHGRSRVVGHDIELLRRVVLSTLPLDRAEVLGLFPNHRDGLAAKSCAQGIKKSHDRATEILEELVRIEVLVSEPGEPRGGRPATVYRPVPKFADLITAPTVPLLHLTGR
jgi:hypothetical protein